MNTNVDYSTAVIWNLAEKHKDTWHDRSDRQWFLGLLEEVVELGLALLGLHKHDWQRPQDNAVDWELKQIASICINWHRHRQDT